ncbi:MAG: ABC transporter permease [Theionarchaea archaeon]|nr:ABC transporter permease [Theionarchaea archaeon]
MKRKITIFFIRKVLGAVITLFLVMSLLFFLLHSVAGGDMVTRMLPFGSAEEKAQLRSLWGLDKPLSEQYLIFMKKVFTLNYRLTPDQQNTSLDELLFFLPYTVLLFGTATITSYVIGIFLGIKLLQWKNKAAQGAILGILILLYSIPAFAIALTFKNWLVFRYQIFPPVNLFNHGASTLLEHLINIQRLLPAMVLPLSILVLVGLARPFLLLRDHMSYMLDEPYILTARAKGLTEDAVLSEHVARCAMLPLMSDASINLALIFSGGILIEYIFSWPGLGTQLFNALRVLYYPTIAAAIFLLTMLLLFSMILVDIINVYMDPRVST